MMWITRSFTFTFETAEHIPSHIITMSCYWV